MGKQVKVTSIQIKYPDGTSKDLSIEEAKQLFEQLDQLFGDKATIVDRPVYIERDRWPRWTTQHFLSTESPDKFSEPKKPMEPPPKGPEIWAVAKE